VAFYGSSDKFLYIDGFRENTVGNKIEKKECVSEKEKTE